MERLGRKPHPGPAAAIAVFAGGCAAPESTARRGAYWKLVACTLCLLAVPASLLLARGLRSRRPAPHVSLALSLPSLTPAPGQPSVSAALQPVWLVKQTSAFETYSNGLRIDDRFTVSSHRRSYLAYTADGNGLAAGPRRASPAGIVFHTTESLEIPFEAALNTQLKRVGQSVLEFVVLHRAYHFLIDRFGRVYRVVAETDVANHAGHSVWSDGQSVYLNLNDSFLGVSFEAHTNPAPAASGRGETGGIGISPAQVRASAMLTEMLRDRYAIAARNCVTHAQVSVNPASMLAGYHTDWASGFPFEQLGLPDNYAVPLPAIALFGFHYDEHFAGLEASSLYPGVERGERSLRDTAAGLHISLEALRQTLQTKYREHMSAAREVTRDTDLEAAAAE